MASQSNTARDSAPSPQRAGGRSFVPEITVGSLFAGIGGFDLGLEWVGMKVLWQVEIDDYCNQVLAKHWPHVARFRDVRECGSHNLAPVDLICGGFPCQGFSYAGKRRGKADDRYLWPEMLRIIAALRPAWVLGENVPGIIGLALDTVRSDLEGEGYQVQPLVIPACAVGAPHRRDRVWIVAYNPECAGRPNATRGIAPIADSNGQEDGLSQQASLDAANAHRGRREEQRQSESGTPRLPGAEWDYWGSTESPLCGADYGVPCGLDRVARIRALGNSVVPQVVEVIGRVILAAHTNAVERAMAREAGR